MDTPLGDDVDSSIARLNERGLSFADGRLAVSGSGIVPGTSAAIVLRQAWIDRDGIFNSSQFGSASPNAPARNLPFALPR